jgi:hypothetical protein
LRPVLGPLNRTFLDQTIQLKWKAHNFKPKMYPWDTP